MCVRVCGAVCVRLCFYACAQVHILCERMCMRVQALVQKDQDNLRCPSGAVHLSFVLELTKWARLVVERALGP